MAAPAAGKKLFGLQPKVAIIVFIVVGVGVFLYIRNRSANAAVPTQTQTTPQVAATGTDPNATGGVTQAAAVAPDLTGILDALVGQTNSLASNYQQPSIYYNAPYQSPTTSEYTYNYSGTSPAAPVGSSNTQATPSSGAPFPVPAGTTHYTSAPSIDPGFNIAGSSAGIPGPSIFAFK